MWRWAEEEWKKKASPSKWKIWKRAEVQKEQLDAPATKSLPHFQKALNEWMQETTRLQGGAEIPRPPSISENNLVVILAERIGEDHRLWKVDTIKPDFPTEKKG